MFCLRELSISHFFNPQSNRGIHFTGRYLLLMMRISLEDCLRHIKVSFFKNRRRLVYNFVGHPHPPPQPPPPALLEKF